jgi:predicted AlkP superfamily phosphohydrolase/phosphomutase
MQEQPWNVFVATFSAPHCIGHHFWRFMDSSHPRHPKRGSHALAGAIEQVYRAIDVEIGEMLALAGDTTRCMVVAAHGMGPLYHASWNLPEILDLLGYGRRPVVRAATERRRVAARVNPWRIVRLVLPGALQYRIKALLPQPLQDRLLFLWYAGGQDWNGRRAFALPNNDTVGAIRLSVRGRDRNGTVAPGDEYRRVCHEIAEGLSALSDPVTKRPVVRRVTLTHDEFHGPFLNQLPDVTVLWDQRFPWNSLHSPSLGTFHLPRQDARSGSHTPRGFVILTGPGVPRGAELTDRSIYDIAPTVLHAAAVPIPPDLDGSPLLRQPLTVSR